MKRICLLLLLITGCELGAIYLAFAQGTWLLKGNVGGLSRHAGVGFTINNFGYMCSGVNGGNNLLNDLWQYDAIANTWTQKASLPGAPRDDAAGFSIGNYGYLGTGGGSAGFLN